MKTIQSIDRAVLVMEYISKNQNCRLIDMSNYFNLKKSTLHGILSTLKYHGLINKDSVSTKYTLGSKVFELGKLYEDNLSIKKIAKPYLIKLVQDFSETVHLGVLNNLTVLYIDKEESPHSLRMTSKVGTTDPLLTTAIGKAILAYLPDDKLNYIVKTSKSNELTDYSISEKSRLLDELSIIRKKGFSLDLEELELGLNCISTPIKNSINESIAAISISIPSIRFNKIILANMRKELLIISNEISQKL
ncbi:IclR family transcriptional regulator [Clostridium algoriphilum]|uniref:IclR family transcriptional regulator n=1 Tax=Clostridium algoriphilum TaxID=198347 RepID=UPI001CF59363|nr:IclR family transcriptional regulator [Clostridium algoriphilum]MCB2294761.1 IclR family transcriptional regulator [Clostridium algoriphilum]